MGFTVKSEMAGVVAAIEILEGTAVTDEEAVIILSAMKMEIPIAAGRPGSVAEILVAEGDVVTVGQSLFVIE